MRTQIRWSTALAALAVLTLGSALRAAPPVTTTITIPDMHCQGCAKKVADQLYQVRGVAAVQANVQAKTLTVTPRAQAILSPRDLWEAVEKADKRPTRLQGPSGTFTAKPQS
ncbi:MAG TPA: heavy-metal-associated domain-containing protein [Gemmataceae bacterium]|nr:heavy-metal-associated domain-containing protein [Gemmataceae bacterium]